MLLKHSLYYALARGLPGLIGFFGIALFTRVLTPDQYGQYALVLAYSGLAYTVLFSWLPLGLLRFLPANRDPAQKESLLSAIFRLFWSLSLAVLIVTAGLYLAAPLFSDQPQVVRAFCFLGAVLLWARGWFEINLELRRSALSPKLYGALSTLKVILTILIGGLLAYLGLGAIGLLIGSAAAFLLPALAVSQGYQYRFRLEAAERKYLSQLALYGIPLTATFALEFVISSSDRLLLAWFVDIKAAGLYVVGYDLAKQCLTLLLMIVNLAAYPLAIHAFETGGAQAVKHQLSQNFVLLLTVGLPATAGFALLAHNIADVLVGKAFGQAAAALMPWIAIATLFAGFKAYYVDLSFQLTKKTRLQVLIAFVAAAVNLLLNLWLIPRYGLLGAAYSTLIAYALVLGGGWWLAQRALALPLPLRESSKIICATAIMVLALLPTRHLSGGIALTGQVGSGALVYLAAIILLNVSGSQQMASNFFQKLGAATRARRIKLAEAYKRRVPR